MNSEIKSVAGKGIPLVGNDIDTDRIIPARFLKCITFDGLGEGVFADDRTQTKGQHPFDLPQYQGAKVLVVNANFGCGSSREHAPQAIARWGIQAVIGESFAEIFLGNCSAIGLLCVTAEPETVTHLQSLIQDNPQLSIMVDIESLQLRAGDLTASIKMGDGSRQMMLSGTWDACGQLVSGAENTRATAATLPYLMWQSC
jgi:3-isopropylmalate/(R)-2-methylmalate dehydratase small subunit